MKRLAIALSLFVLVALGAAVIVGSSGGSASYLVAARFDSAGAIVAGEDVEVAGAVVGTVQSLGLTRDYKAVLTLAIDRRAFTPFHQDASCTIRSQGVLAVEFVDCSPGSSTSPPLPAGPGGTHVLSVQHTSAPIEFDLVTNIMRAPAAEYLQTLISELGTGLTARGGDLGAVIRRSNPGLAQTDRVLSILAAENQSISSLLASADAVARPLAAQRAALARFVGGAEVTGAASAQQSANLERSIERLPGFLRALRPILAQLGTLSDQGVPVLAALRSSAPQLTLAAGELAPFARRGIPATRTLGSLAAQATPALLSARPLIGDLRTLAAAAPPSASKLASLTGSFQQQAGITHLLQLLFYSTNAVNGFDADGHYARAELLSGACSEYTASGYFGCAAQFGGTSQVAKPIRGTLVRELRTLFRYLIGTR